MNIKNQKLALVLVGMGALAFGGCAATSAQEGSVAVEGESLSKDVCPDGVPTSLAPAADQTIKGAFNAVGTQVYMCSDGVGTGPAWTFVAPQANLLTDSGQFVATHFIGPTWQGNDGSSVVGSKVAGATVDSTALPWLLLTAKSHADTSGFFADVTSIQRLSTVGGNAPTTGCDATKLGTILQVPYSAEYVFYKTKSQGRVVQCSGS